MQQRELIKPLRIPYQEPSLRADTLPGQTSSATSRLISTDTKPSAFLLSSNVQDNYSAYRLNSNMGLSSTPDASKSKMRTGFFGEVYSSQGQRSQENFAQQQYVVPQSAGKSPFYQSGNSVVASTGWSNPYANYNEHNMYNQPYPMKPSHFSQQSVSQNPSYNNYPKYVEPHQNVLLPPIYMSPPPMYYPRRQQSVSHYRPQNDDDGFAKVERLFMTQTRHLESLIRNYDRSESGTYGDQTPQQQQHRSLLSRGQNESRGGMARNNSTPHPPYPKLLNDVHTANNQGTPEPHKNSGAPSVRTSPTGEPVEDSEDMIKDAEDVSPKEDKDGKKKKKKKGTAAAAAGSGLKLRYALWAIVYPTLLNKVVEKQVEDKKKSSSGNSQYVKEANIQVIAFIKQHCTAALESLYKDSKAMAVIADGKKLTDKDLTKNFTALTDKLVPVLEALSKAITHDNLPKPFIDFFAGISKNFAVLPQKFLSEYEIHCMEFSHYGTLKNMNPFKIKMLIGMYLLVKGLVYTFLTQPWIIFPKHKKSTNFAKKLKNCSSVLYHVVMDYFKENLQATKNNQSFLPPDKRLKPIKDPLVAFVDNADTIQALQSAGPLEVIHGLYNRESLIECWTSQKDSVNKLKTLVEECLEKLCTIIQESQAFGKK